VRLLAAALALLVGLTLTAPPALAAGPAQPLASAAAAKVAAMPNATLAQTAAPATAPAAGSGKSFLKSGKGALACVLLAGALGYTFYSFSNDRVKSPAR
jgi:hypothetical protein